ncbi:DUF4124 domain-containing protein [Derxia gummosa]|uniref:DUF4124 domain-containing protein n=1 Tax=Derxia gummosa DSM 723 TaxID=1121388 RepID=A0A8B6XB70_9BURK|nr:DUF4124 domain-containing protein [Derxia gummosa]
MSFVCNTRLPKSMIAAGAVLVLAFAAIPADAQWAWRDTNGSTVFSDQPPPSNITTDRILRRPTLNTSPASSTSAPTSSQSKPQRSISEVANDLEKRRKERLENESKESESNAQNMRRAEDCKRLSLQRDALASGVRIRSQETGGAMNDGEREVEIARLDEQFNSFCR